MFIHKNCSSDEDVRSKLVKNIQKINNYKDILLSVLSLLLISLHIRGSLNKFPDFFRMDTFIDSTHMKL